MGPGEIGQNACGDIEEETGQRVAGGLKGVGGFLALIHNSEPTRPDQNSYAVLFL
ncbi:hypothetical protein NGUA02_01076 [Salmonella enterica]|nr:hypothetical protein NGUA02_01076 [Salmonella enterica]